MATWSEDQLILAMEFFYTCPERMHTDSHQKCQEMAALVGHTPGALDQVLRNIKFVETGGTGLEHASQQIHDLVNHYRNSRLALMQRAAQVRMSRNLPPLDCGH